LGKKPNPPRKNTATQREKYFKKQGKTLRKMGEYFLN
jgi:hypothetical protein